MSSWPDGTTHDLDEDIVEQGRTLAEDHALDLALSVADTSAAG
jgi:hypothetical protein